MPSSGGNHLAICCMFDIKVRRPLHMSASESGQDDRMHRSSVALQSGRSVAEIRQLKYDTTQSHHLSLIANNTLHREFAHEMQSNKPDAKSGHHKTESENMHISYSSKVKSIKSISVALFSIASL